MNVWDAELVVDERLVRRLLRRFPELELASVERLAEGWDRSAWLVDRLSRLAPELAVTTTVEPGGGQFLLVLTTR